MGKALFPQNWDKYVGNDKQLHQLPCPQTEQTIINLLESLPDDNKFKKAYKAQTAQVVTGVHGSPIDQVASSHTGSSIWISMVLHDGGGREHLYVTGPNEDSSYTYKP